MLNIIFDFLLPNTCAVCGCTLPLRRSGLTPSSALCSDCLMKAVRAQFRLRFKDLQRCSICGYPLTSEKGICMRCREKSCSYDSSSSLFLYDGIIKTLISSYKFENRKSLAGFFACCISHEIKNSYPDFTVVPVPYRPSAKRKRGWDQVELICRLLEFKYGIPVKRCLQRKNGPAQKTMNYEMRKSNLSGKIVLKKGRRPPVKTLLLDDVFTTGATMDCCASILKDSGSLQVLCLSLALDL